MKRALILGLIVAVLLVGAGSIAARSQPSLTVVPRAAPQAAPAAPTDLFQASGRLSLLRVHDVGTGYGGGAEFIDVEVVIWLDTRPGKAYGFQLRNDGNRVARQAMLDVLRDAFANNYLVTINYSADPGRDNGVINRVWVTK